MKIESRTLEGEALNWSVAKAEGHDVDDPTWWGDFGDECDYGTNWNEGGPILFRERISVVIDSENDYFEAARNVSTSNMMGFNGEHYATGGDYLEAGLRCHVLNKLGEYVDVPDEIVNMAKRQQPKL